MKAKLPAGYPGAAANRSMRPSIHCLRCCSYCLEALAIEAGMVPLESRAQAAVSAGLTIAAEIRRVMGNRQVE